jgi:hypothetical protein
LRGKDFPKMKAKQKIGLRAEVYYR